jgi:hydrogenase expression/formation protein HypC
MCLAYPGKVISITGDYAEVDINGNIFNAYIKMLPVAKVGHYVLVHAGYALQIVDERDALITLALLEEMNEDGQI